jgi:NAD(P)-dependent dehydrogenase (short-subunit alcohol dehydrogenase family)
MDINGVGAIVTGGASGLGEATCRLLAQRGARVVVLDLQDEAGTVLAKELGGVFAHANVADPEEVGAAVDAATELGPLRVLVNCAGIGYAARTIGRDGTYSSAHDLDAYRRVIEVNLVGTFNCIRLAATAMSQTSPLSDGERGAIVNTASIAAFEGQIGQVAYTAAKAGIAGMSLTMARDLGSLGIRVMAIAPSLFATGSTARIPEDMAATLTRDAAYPRRMGRPEEYANLATAIVENQMLNGGTIRLDGGQRFAPR